MKNSKTLIKELKQQYKTHLLKSFLCALTFFSFSPVGLATEIPDTTIPQTILNAKTLILNGKNATATYSGSWYGWSLNKDGERSDAHGTTHDFDVVDLSNGASLNLGQIRFEFIEDNESLTDENGNPTNYISITGGSKLTLTNASFDASSDDEFINNFKTTINNAHLNILDSEFPVNGPVKFENESTLYYSCLNCSIPPETVGDPDEYGRYQLPNGVLSTYDYTIQSSDLEIINSNVILGDYNRAKDAGKTDEAKLEASGSLTIDNSTLTVSDHAILSYNGIDHTDGGDAENNDYMAHIIDQISILDSTLVFNNNAQMLIGTNDVEATKQATLKIEKTNITFNDKSKIKFDKLNKENTTITNSSVITLNDEASMELNNLDISNNSKIIMNDKSSVKADNVLITDSEILMNDETSLEAYNVTFKNGTIEAAPTAKLNINTIVETDENGQNTTNTPNMITLDNMTINVDILSDHVENKVVFKGDILFNSLFDPATGVIGDETTSAFVTKNGYDDGITYEINNGTLSYQKDLYLYDNEKHGSTYALNSIHLNGGTLNIQNNAVSDIKLKELSISKPSSLYLDADLKNKKMDTITADNTLVNATLHVKGINLISDASETKTTINFTQNESLKENVVYSGNQNITALSPLYQYSVSYDKESGNFEFTQTSQNPSNTSATVITKGIGLIQSSISNIAFNEISIPTNEQSGHAGGDVNPFKNVWAKVIGIDDDVDFKSFETIENKTISAMGGFTSNDVQLNDMTSRYGLYFGYITGEQKFTQNEITQNGGYMGLTAHFEKEKLFLQTAFNLGFMRNESENSFGTDKFNSYWAGIGAKMGYNYGITPTIYLTPSVYAGYTVIKTNDYTSKSGVKIDNDSLKLFEITPALKLTNNFKNGWHGFTKIQYSIVNDTDGRVKANDIALENISLKNYVEYGFGVEKNLSSNLDISLDLNRRDGGRKGWNGSIMLQYKF